MSGNKLEQSDIPTIDVGCAMLCICQFWCATALKYRVAMCLMKYYPFVVHWVWLYIVSSIHDSRELQYVCLLHLSSLTKSEKEQLQEEVELTKEPAAVAHGNMHIVCNYISSEHSAKMYQVIGSVLYKLVNMKHL